jgi:TPR repeat protein
MRSHQAGGILRREDITLRRAARAGDIQAAFEMARRYLSGSGMPKNIAVGLQYLLPQRASAEAAMLVCRCLPLHELIEHGQIDLLSLYGDLDPQLRVKLGVWQVLAGRLEDGLEALRESLPRGSCTGELWNAYPPSQGWVAVLEHLGSLGIVDARAVALASAKRACLDADLERFSRTLRLAIDLKTADSLTREWIYKAVTLSLAQHRAVLHLDAHHIHAALEFAAAGLDPQPWLILGLALCGLPCGPNPAAALVTRENLRKGTALLMRAAHAGYTEAWLHLHKLSSNPRCSVANPEMARFFLEKAAAAGHSEAQRRLGALILSRSRTLVETEGAVGWLHLAAQQRDAYASDLLRSLVLPVDGDPHDAEAALSDIERIDPWLSARLRLAREFGLTKQEALSLDPIAAERPWGLVTTAIPYLSHNKLSAPRVVPAVSPAAVSALRHAVVLFSRASYHELDSAQRSNSQRRRLAHLALDETLFFPNADSSERDRVRIGTRWAHHARTLLLGALSPAVAAQRGSW